MNTPITDLNAEPASYYQDAIIGVVPEAIARRLEADRAALMDALANLERRATFGTVSEEYLNESRRALSAARANFPTP